MSQKLLFVVNHLFPFGFARQLELVSRELCQTGIEVHIAVLSEPIEQQNNLTSGIVIHHIGRRRARDYGVMLRLRKLAKQLHPELIHSWGYDALNMAAIALHAIDVRHIASLFSIPHQQSLAFRFGMRHLIRNVQLVACHSAIVDFLEHEFFVEPDRPIKIISNAAEQLASDRNLAREQILTHFKIKTESPILIGAAAEWHQRTRLKDLLWATDLLYCIRDDIHLVVFGTGPQKKQLLRFRSLTLAESNIHFVEDDRKCCLTGLDLFLQSHLTEPQPSGLLTSMACGIPSISVLGRGTEKIIEHQSSALAVNYGARDEFARWTKYLVEQQSSSRLLAEQGKAHVDEKFPVGKMFNSYNDIYQL